MEKQNEVVVQGGSPTELIQQAISAGADLDKLEKLLQLKREYEKDEARKSYHRAMAEFKANPPKIDKDREVSFDTNRGKTSYRHATLGNVTEKINAELSKHGLSASWTTQQNGKIRVTCRITHVQGHSEETSLEADSDTSGSKNPIQAIGSTITYLERYTLLALTGLATYDQDDDGITAGKSDNGYINDSQKSILIDLLVDFAPDKVVKYLKFLGVESLDVLPKAKFQQAKEAVEAAKRAKAVAK